MSITINHHITMINMNQINASFDREYEYALNLLPGIGPEDCRILCNLPRTMQLIAPYVAQEEKHYSAAACVQMTAMFLNEPFDSQAVISATAGWNDWTALTHASYKEGYAHYLISKGYPAYHYYPQAFVASKLRNGIMATQLIRRNRAITSEYDFTLFKLMLAKTQAPIKARVHFTTDHYQMSESQAMKIDMSGHCVMIVGYNEEGFIVHDPWDRAKWGGTRGGAYSMLRYAELADEFNFVNYSKEEITPNGRLSCHISTPKEAVLTNSTFTVEAYCTWPGIKGTSIPGCR